MSKSIVPFYPSLLVPLLPLYPKVTPVPNPAIGHALVPINPTSLVLPLLLTLREIYGSALNANRV